MTLPLLELLFVSKLLLLRELGILFVSLDRLQLDPVPVAVSLLASVPPVFLFWHPASNATEAITIHIFFIHSFG